MLLWGVGLAVLGALVAFLNHMISPQLLFYTAADERFTGIAWSQLNQANPQLATWLTLFYDTTAMMMVWYGFLTAVAAATAYRRGERWAWIALLLSFGASSAYLSVASASFFTQGILDNSGISIGIVGLGIILAFLVFGLILPAREVWSQTPVGPVVQQKGSWKLSFGWLALFLVLGVANIVTAIIVPAGDHLLYPGGSLTYLPSDPAFTNVSWPQLIALSPQLGYWIVLQMDNMCARMLGGGILAAAIAVKGVRRANRWAYYGLLGGTLLWYVPFLLVSIPAWQAGVIEATTISAGLPPDPSALPWLLTGVVGVLALVLLRSHIHGQVNAKSA